jgi:hypothetical protein
MDILLSLLVFNIIIITPKVLLTINVELELSTSGVGGI